MKLFISIFLLLFTLTLLSASTKIMLLGDSITYDDAYIDHPSLGGGSPRPASLRHGYRNHLWYLLRDSQYQVDFVGSQIAGTDIVPIFDPDNEGYPGETSNDIADKTYNLLVDNPADIILLYIGANDWSDDVSGITRILNNIDYYERDYYHPVKVIIARIANRRTPQSWMTHLNKNIQRLVNQRKLDNDDIYIVDMEYNAEINYPNDFQDRTHPNDLGYSKIANAWFKVLQNILPKPEPLNPLIQPFVERFYTTILQRQGDEEGIRYWIEKLSTHTLSASDLARGFINSDEFKNENTDNQTFIVTLYHAFFNREPDITGLTYWETKLENDVSRFNVLNGFLYSSEFYTLAQSYNIEAVAPSELFVTRFYTKALDRDPEENGLKYWLDKLRTYQTTARGIAKAFFFSDEFIMKQVSNEEYLILLYRTLLDREPDTGGLERWDIKLQEGLSREKVLNSFIYSSEFKALARLYNIRL